MALNGPGDRVPTLRPRSRRRARDIALLLQDRRHEPAERLLQELRELDRRRILEMGADDLHADRQAGVRPPDRRHGRRQSGAGGWRGPDDVVDIRLALAVDVET